MKERPLLFSGPMVRAILEGRKTQTRRVATAFADWQPVNALDGLPVAREIPYGRHQGKFGAVIEVQSAVDDTTTWEYPCPFGRVGDRLWVRETFSTSGLTKWHYTGNPDDHGGPDDPCCAYAATGTYRCGKRIPDGALAIGSHKWKSPMLMPRRLSRLLLEIEDIRVQRVQDISEADCEAELGVPPYSTGDDAYALFCDLWDSINAKRGYGWDANPWIWVIAFKPVGREAHQP